MKFLASITLPEQAAPATPASGRVILYTKTDGRLYYKDDAGTEIGPIEALPTNTVTTDTTQTISGTKTTTAPFNVNVENATSGTTGTLNAFTVGSRGGIFSYPTTGVAGVYLTDNAYFDGTNWKTRGGVDGSAYVGISVLGGFSFYSTSTTGAAGTTVTLSKRLGVSNGGTLTTTAISATQNITSTAGTVTGTNGVYDGANRVYSASNLVPVAGISATGTASATTYFRGDGSWSTVPAPSNMVTTDTTQTIPVGAAKSFDLGALLPRDVKAQSGQALLFKDNAGATRMLMNSSGVTLFGGTAITGGGVNVLGVTDATTVPTTNPTGGIVVYSESGVLKYRDPSGNIRILDGSGGAGGVTSVTGTANQVSVSPTTGATVVSLPSAITAPGSLTTTTTLTVGTDLTVSGLMYGANQNLAVGAFSTTPFGAGPAVMGTAKTNGSLYLTAHGTGSISIFSPVRLTASQGYFYPEVNNQVVMSIRGATGQSANLQNWQDPSGNPLVSVTSGGRLGIRVSEASSAGILNVSSVGDPGSPVATFRGTTSQTANLSEWQNVGGTVLAKVDTNGSIQSGAAGGINQIAVNDSFINNVSLYANSGTAGRVAIVARGAASQTGNLQEWQNNAGTILARVEADGRIVTFAGDMYVATKSAGTIGIQVRSFSGQTANLQEWQSNGGTPLALVDASGNIQAAAFYAPALRLTGTATGSIVAQVRGASGQTASLQQWQNTGGSAVAYVGPDGASWNLVKSEVEAGSNTTPPTYATLSNWGLEANTTESTIGGYLFKGHYNTTEIGAIRMKHLFSRDSYGSGQMVFQIGSSSTEVARLTSAGLSVTGTVTASGGVYDGANRVYSAGNPPPGGGGGVSSVTGTANQITVTGTTTPVLSLPSALSIPGEITMSAGSMRSAGRVQAGSTSTSIGAALYAQALNANEPAAWFQAAATPTVDIWRATASDGTTILARLTSANNLHVIGTANDFGAGAAGGTGGYLRIGSSTNDAAITALSSASDANITYTAKGLGTHIFNQKINALSNNIQTTGTMAGGPLQSTGRTDLATSQTTLTGIYFGSYGTMTGLSSSSILSHNVYYDGTNWRARALGGGSAFSIGQGGLSYSAASSVAADAITTMTNLLSFASTGSQFNTDLTINGGTLLLGDDAAPTTPTSTQVALYSTGGRGKLRDAAGNIFNLDSSQLTRLSAAATSTSITNPPVTVATGLTQALQPGTYAFELNGWGSVSVTTIGLRFAVNFTGTQTAIAVGGFVATGGTTQNNGYTAVNNSIADTATTGLTTPLPFQFTGTIVVTVAGNLEVRFGCSAAGTATLATGTYLRVTRVA